MKKEKLIELEDKLDNILYLSSKIERTQNDFVKDLYDELIEERRVNLTDYKMKMIYVERVDKAIYYLENSKYIIDKDVLLHILKGDEDE